MDFISRVFGVFLEDLVLEDLVLEHILVDFGVQMTWNVMEM